MSLILVILLVLLLCGGIGFSPIVNANASYGWAPSGIAGVLVLILVLYLLGVI